MSIGTNIIIWPWIFIVRNSTVFPLGVWTDIICDVFASAVMAASNAAAVSRIRESLNICIFTSLEDFFEYQAETITGNSQIRHEFSLRPSRRVDTKVSPTNLPIARAVVASRGCARAPAASTRWPRSAALRPWWTSSLRTAGSALLVGSAYNNRKFWKTKSVGLFSSSPTLQQKVFEIKLTLAAMQRTTATQAH